MFGWVPDVPDIRDYYYTTTRLSLPLSVDLRDLCPPIYDQGKLGSCVAFSCNSLYEYMHTQQMKTDFHGSELFTYYNARVIEHTVRSDAGCSIRDAMKCLHTQGVCSETAWPYTIRQFKKRPPLACYNAAKQDIAFQYQRVVPAMMKAVLAEGHPFVIGVAVYDSFLQSRNGYIPLPDVSQERVLGGHAIMIVGYTGQNYWFRNSWGTQWGMDGYGQIPMGYLEDKNLSDDSWMIVKVT